MSSERSVWKILYLVTILLLVSGGVFVHALHLLSKKQKKRNRLLLLWFSPFCSVLLLCDSCWNLTNAPRYITTIWISRPLPIWVPALIIQCRFRGEVGVKEGVCQLWVRGHPWGGGYCLWQQRPQHRGQPVAHSHSTFEYAYCTPIPKHTLKYTKVKVLQTLENVPILQKNDLTLREIL